MKKEIYLKTNEFISRKHSPSCTVSFMKYIVYEKYTYIYTYILNAILFLNFFKKIVYMSYLDTLLGNLCKQKEECRLYVSHFKRIDPLVDNV